MSYIYIYIYIHLSHLILSYASIFDVRFAWSDFIFFSLFISIFYSALVFNSFEMSDLLLSDIDERKQNRYCFMLIFPRDEVCRSRWLWPTLLFVLLQILFFSIHLSMQLSSHTSICKSMQFYCLLMLFILFALILPFHIVASTITYLLYPFEERDESVDMIEHLRRIFACNIFP